MRKSLAEIYEDEPEASSVPASVSENPFNDLDDVNEIDLREYQVRVKKYSRVQDRVKNLRQKFSEGA